MMFMAARRYVFRTDDILRLYGSIINASGDGSLAGLWHVHAAGTALNLGSLPNPKMSEKTSVLKNARECNITGRSAGTSLGVLRTRASGSEERGDTVELLDKPRSSYVYTDDADRPPLFSQLFLSGVSVLSNTSRMVCRCMIKHRMVGRTLTINLVVGGDGTPKSPFGRSG